MAENENTHDHPDSFGGEDYPSDSPVQPLIPESEASFAETPSAEEKLSKLQEVVSSCQEVIMGLQQEKTELVTALQRAKADFDNFQKRAKRDRDLLKKEITRFIETPESRDYKSDLQEYTQNKMGCIPVYRVIREVGPDHEKQFEVVVSVKDTARGKGMGRSKKEAEQAAAKVALDTYLKT